MQCVRVYKGVALMEIRVQTRSLHENISNIATIMPHKTAIECGDQSISFIELEERTNQIANFLYSKIDNNKNIAVLLENSVELVEAIVGILKCGGIFVPLDPSFPKNRIKLMMDVVDADWIITRSAWLEKLDRMMEGESKRLNVLVLDLESPECVEFKNIDVIAFDESITKESLFPLDPIN